ncbi:NusA-like transcription termination signal-binding factor [Methanospirillum stamsii]|uniref:Probable transcription termination protein NusA n=1 Tax=Methanospirillum stamsii TaxID=1277351 RepID=A0A2V2N4W4_9EURY|nr:NusA-like transcription termination signal-binding factor [Methanospirillum stamsii]PWR70303.1 NusA-like transcription termination signal-binding factor [Methanospirillum stamsii]
MGVVLNEETIALIAQFERLTGAGSRDVIDDGEDERLIFIINPGDMGFAIGKKGLNIKKASESFGKKIEAVEYSDDPAQFIRNCFHPAQVKEVQFSDYHGDQIAHVVIRDEDRGRAIGKSGKNLDRSKMLALREHDIKNIIIE